MNRTVKHHYRRFRQHQLDTYGNSRLYINGVDQRQFTGGGAFYGHHAIAAYASARQHIHFMQHYERVNGRRVLRAYPA